jgi:hypothetical protein
MWFLFFWAIPAVIVTHILSNRWLKIIFCLFFAIYGLLSLFTFNFLANFKRTPLIGFHIASASIIILIIGWIALIVITLTTPKISQTESGIKSRIEKMILVLVLLTTPVLSYNMINGSKVQYRVFMENKTPQILYLTAITTDHGNPKVISKRNIPIQPQSSMDLDFEDLDFDITDIPLAGIAVCRTEDDCRLLPHNSDSSIYKINSYESLERLNPSWLAAIRSSPLYNNSSLIIMALSLVPILLLLGWLYLNRRQKSKNGMP